MQEGLGVTNFRFFLRFNSITRYSNNFKTILKMKKYKILLACLIVAFSASVASAQIAVKADTVYTMNGTKIVNGIVLVNEGVIEAVGKAGNIDIPEDYKTMEATVVTPGLIDAHTVVGLAGIFNRDGDQNQLETSSPIQPQLRARDSYNAREQLVKFLMKKGITTIHTGHGPGALISGQTMIAKTAYRKVGEALVKGPVMIAMTIGPTVGRNFDSPGTVSKGIAMLRQTLLDTQEYMEKEDSKTDLKKEVLADLLRGEIRALVTAQRAQDILTALRLQEEFGFEMVLAGAAEAYLVMDEIKEAGIPVIIHPTMVRTFGATKNASFTTPAKVEDAGILMAFSSGYEGYVPKTRVILYEAAIAVANGMEREAALQALTIDAAKILGISDQVGSLEEGKDADIVLYDGDPFEYTTHVTGVIIDGKVVKD
jgi:imidazolonepropionase-like amidohydrolase